jgi:superfamily II DNA or RNA helicase
MADLLHGSLFQQELINIILGDGFLRVEPTVPNELTKELKYWHREFQQDPDQPWRGREIKGEYRQLYETDFSIDPNTQKVTNFLLTLPGFLSRIKRVLAEHGYRYAVIDRRTPYPVPDCTRAMQGLRDYQYEPALDLIMAQGGIASCPTGFGKTHLMAALIRAFSPDDLRIRGTPLTVLSAVDRDVAAKNYRDLCSILPDREIGFVTSGKTKWSDDVQVITMDSLHRLKSEDVGLFIADEVHTAGTEKRSENIAKLTKAWKWGVSATPLGRFDGGDLKTEGLFGPLVVDIPYSHGVDVGALVPITVYFVQCPIPPVGLQHYQGYKMHHKKLEYGIEKNDNLSDLVAQLVGRIPPDMQTMLIMQHQAQLNELKKRMPHIPDVHATTSGKDLMAKGFKYLQPVSGNDRDEFYRKMESAELKRVMCTYVYKQGVNFPQLEVMICPGGGGSKIVAGQIPGRGSRRVAGKDAAYIVDFWHQWDTVEVEEIGKPTKSEPGPLLRDDRSRDKVYEKLGFKRVWVDNLDALPFLLR